MKPEYDLKKMKVKRRGVLPEMHAKTEDHAKVRITISLDKDVIQYFKHRYSRGCNASLGILNQAVH